MPDPKHAVEQPATFGEVFANREFRAVFSAGALSWTGDFIARAAVTALVFSSSRSVALSAAAFAVTYLPTLTAGPVLSALAERYPQRTVMVTCDVVRAGLIALVAIPHLPIPAVLVLLFLTALLNPPFDASRSALLPRILEGDQYVVGLAASTTTNTAAQIVGYAAGGIVGAFYPSVALLIDAGTFLLSAALISFGTRPRPVIASATARRHLLRETAAGFRRVYASPVLRAIAALALAASLFATVPEGIAAAWAAKISHTAESRGTYQALIMMAGPVGSVLGALIVGRLLPPARRRQLIRPLAVIVPLALGPILLVHSVVVIAICTGISGFAAAGLLTPANGLFVQALPAAFRARAFGVMQFGLQLVQAVSVLTVGLLGDHLNLYTTVGAWGLGGTVVVTLLLGIWPAPQVIDQTISDTQTANAKAAQNDGPDAEVPLATDDIPIGPTVEIPIGVGYAPYAAAAEASTEGPFLDDRPTSDGADRPSPNGRHAAPQGRPKPRQSRMTPTRLQDSPGELSQM